MGNMESFTPLYAIAYAITNSMENSRFDKEDYFNVLVFYTGYIIKEIENIFFHVFPGIRYRNTRRGLGELQSIELIVKLERTQKAYHKVHT